VDSVGTGQQEASSDSGWVGVCLPHGMALESSHRLLQRHVEVNEGQEAGQGCWEGAGLG
jgi:hypothetical protein